MYALFERVDDINLFEKKRLVVNRFHISPDADDNSKTDNKSAVIDQETQVSREDILFVFLDRRTSAIRDVTTLLRVISDHVHKFSNVTKCLNLLQDSKDRIFLILTSNDKDLIKQVHDYPAVEAIFIWNSDIKIDRIKFPKLIGAYIYFEELLVSLRNTLEWFEQTQLEFVTFEHDRLFLWFQLWNEFIRPTNPQVPSKKDKFLDMTERYYRGNLKVLESLEDFDCCYERNDALQWCFISPFPSRFLHHALSSHNMKQIDHCRFLINDISRILHQSNATKSNRQFYRGMKVTNEDLEKLMKHTGKLICPKGFFTCHKSRKTALDIAYSPNYRSDLRPVIFKINCPPSVPLGEVPSTGAGGLVVFDLYTAFRVKYVSRGPVSIVKLETASEDGKNIARKYRKKYKSESVRNLLDQLSSLQKPKEEEEKRAQQLIEDGQIDQGLEAYQRLQIRSPRVLNTLGQLYGDKKGDYDSAVKYYKQALNIQEKNNEDISETLTQLGIAYHNRGEFDLALACHNRTLDLQKNKQTANASFVVSSMIGIANAQWGQNNLDEALRNAQQALALNESIESENDLNLAMNLVVLANIHHKTGDDHQALDYIQRALTLVERCLPSDSLTLASILNHMGVIQTSLGLFSDAQRNIDRALKICEKNLPEGHSKRVIMEANNQRNKEIIQEYGENAQIKT